MTFGRILIATVCLALTRLLSAEPAPVVPPAEEPLKGEAKALFEQGKYAEARAIFLKLAEQSPGNVYTLSNLGVTLFRMGKFDEAEAQFKKALAVAPADGFSHATLGIVYYNQARYALATESLERAIAIDENYATAHNYLGITWSQRGFQEKAADELKIAVRLDPAYGDAYFNLAVVLATKNPPDKELARGYYVRALKLGADVDEALEQIVGMVDSHGVRIVTNTVKPQRPKPNVPSDLRLAIRDEAPVFPAGGLTPLEKDRGQGAVPK